jgi:hypothetical protein
MFRLLLLILIFTNSSSCSHLGQKSLLEKKLPDLVNSLRGEGEGRGRLGMAQHQYLFSFEAFVNDNLDWVLAAAIPLHGEEILIFKNMQDKNQPHHASKSFELRLLQGIKEFLVSQGESPALASDFLQELRSVLRLVLHQKLKLDLRCEKKCQLEDQFYEPIISAGQFSLKKIVLHRYEIELTASNLTDSIFKRTNVVFRLREAPSSRAPLLTLELFWK